MAARSTRSWQAAASRKTACTRLGSSGMEGGSVADIQSGPLSLAPFAAGAVEARAKKGPPGPSSTEMKGLASSLKARIDHHPQRSARSRWRAGGGSSRGTPPLHRRGIAGGRSASVRAIHRPTG
jgi:hypothetical protein